MNDPECLNWFQLLFTHGYWCWFRILFTPIILTFLIIYSVKKLRK